MKPVSQDLLDLIPQPKALGARATFRKTRPAFALEVLNDSLGITDPSLIDSCAYGTGILRVTNYGGYLYTQYISDIYASWPNWVDSGIAIMEGSRPGVDAGYVWYQKSNASLYYRDYADMSTEHAGREDGDGYPEVLAPISNLRCYSIAAGFSTAVYDYGARVHVGVVDIAESFWLTAPFRLPAVTTLRIDVVSMTNEVGDVVDYVYFSDRDAGRVVEMTATWYTQDVMVWGKPRQIIAIDAIDDVYGLNLHGATLIDGKVVVTGRLTRSSDGDPVSMDVYLLGPDEFSLGRDMYVSGSQIGGPMLVVGDDLIVPGVSRYGHAVGTNMFGIDSDVWKLTTSEIEMVRLQEAVDRSATLVLELSPALSHAAISRGSEVSLEVSYNDNYMTVLTGRIQRISRDNGQGQSLSVEVVNTTSKNLSQWAPEQGIYIPSQIFANCAAADLGKIIRAEGSFRSAPIDGYAGPGKYDDDDAHWTYNGSWSTSTPSGTYDASLHYLDGGVDADGYAEFSFIGTDIVFIYTQSTDRGTIQLWIDEVMVSSFSANGTLTYQVEHAISGLEPGPHTLKVTHGGTYVMYKYIDIDAVEVKETFQSADAGLAVANFNELAILYTAARASRGGSMRARFYNDPDVVSGVGNPRFGVGINFHQESKVEAAARLGVDYSDITDDMVGHNGLVAIYGRREYNNNPALTLYRLEAGELKAVQNSVITLPTGLIWLQMKFVEGLIEVSYRQDTSATWTRRISYSAGHFEPWYNDNLTGHGFVVMERNLLRSSPSYPLAAGDMTLGIDSNTSFSASGKVIVDNEVMSYSGKSSATAPASTAKFEVTAYVDRYKVTDSISGLVAPVLVDVPSGTATTTDLYTGLAAVWLSSDQAAERGLGLYEPFRGGHTLKVTKYWDPTQMWEPNVWELGCFYHKGDTSFGYWATAGTVQRVFGFYPDPYSEMGMLRNPDFEDFTGLFLVRPALYLSARGEDATTASLHGDSTAYEVSEFDLYVDQIEYVSDDEDIALTDALKRIVRISGGTFTDKRIVDELMTVTTNTWTVVPVDGHDNVDFIADITIPVGITETDVKIGMVFRSAATVDAAAPDEGYFLCMENIYLCLYTLSAGVLTLVEKTQVLNWVNFRYGTICFSVQDNRFSVWQDHVFLGGFFDDSLATGTHKAFAVHNPSGVAVESPYCSFSELCSLMADMTVGVRGNGMTVLGEILEKRRVHFRGTADGGLYFYKTAIDAGALPDIVYEERREQADEIATRVRMEGIKIAELADFDLMSEFGNVFETANSVYADTVGELALEAQQHLALKKKYADVSSLDAVYHPALEPGDKHQVTIGAEADLDVEIIAINTAFGFNGDSFVVDSNIQVHRL